MKNVAWITGSRVSVNTYIGEQMAVIHVFITEIQLKLKSNVLLQSIFKIYSY